MKKRITALFLLISILTAAALTSCSDKPDSGKETLTDNAIIGEENEPAETNITDTLRTEDYDGYTFRIFGEEMRDYYYFEAATGEVIEDAVYNRNQKVSELFDINFTYNIITWGTGHDHIIKVTQSGEDAYDLVTNSHQRLGSVITGGCLQNWHQVDDIIDFDAPWYVHDANDTFTIGSNCMLLFGDYLESTIRNCFCFVFNKSKQADYNIPDLYQIVDDGGWTIDKLMEITDGIYSDLNGNGNADGDDFYGFVTDSYAAIDSYCRTLGLSAISKDENNYPFLDFYDEHTVDAYGKLFKLYYEHEGTYVVKAAFTHMDKIFAPGNCAVTECMLIELQNEAVRAMKDEYGVIPYPKYDENQPMSYTHMDGTFSAMMIPITLPVDSLERTALVTEALNALSYDIVRPALYEISFKNKLSRDEESARMMDLVLEGRRFSFDSLDESGFKLSPYAIRELISARKNDIASHYAKYQASAEKWIEKLITAYETNAG